MPRTHGAAFVVAVLAGSLLAGCGSTGAGSPNSLPASVAPGVAQLTVTSADVTSGAFPRELTCDGAGRRPAISLGSLPAGTQSIALEMLDPDAPSGNFTHWLAFSDGAAAAALPSFPPSAAIEGKNDAGTIGYTGPCPPAGPPHHYHVMVFAIGFGLGHGGAGLTSGFSRAQLDSAVRSNRGPVLARGDLVATYSRA